MPVVENTILPLLARSLLIIVFLVAGIAKMRDPFGVAETLVAFGLPEPFAWPLRRVLPALEIGVALLLLIPQTVWWGAIAALALLLLFTAAIAVNLARGANPNCNCFGQLSAGPIGAGSLLRNGLLALVAVFLVALGPRGAASVAGLSLSSQSLLYAGALLFLALFGGLALFTFSLLRGHGRLLLRIEALEEQLQQMAGRPLAPQLAGNGHAAHGGANAAPAGLPIGVQAPEFEAIAPDGSTRTLADLRQRGKPVLLLFAEPGCGPCRELLPDIKRWQSDHLPDLTIALITAAAADKLPLPSALRQREQQISRAYQVGGTPVAILIRPDGAIASAQARGPQEIRDLLRQALALGRPSAGRQPLPTTNGNGARPAPRATGHPLPAVALPALDGEPLDISTLRHSLLIFWNPTCGYCQRMLPDLRRWEQERGPDAPQPVLISRGDRQANRDLKLQAPLLFDDDFSVGRALGAGGTPSAVLVDAQGKVASAVVAGAPGVLALARSANNTAETKEGSHEPMA